MDIVLEDWKIGKLAKSPHYVNRKHSPVTIIFELKCIRCCKAKQQKLEVVEAHSNASSSATPHKGEKEDMSYMAKRESLLLILQDITHVKEKDTMHNSDSANAFLGAIIPIQGGQASYWYWFFCHTFRKAD